MIKRFSPLKPQDIFQFSLPTLLELFENQIFFPSIIIIYCAKGIDKSILWELLSEIMHETTKTKFDFILMTRTEIICTKYLKKKNVTHHHLVTIQKVFKPFAKASSGPKSFEGSSNSSSIRRHCRLHWIHSITVKIPYLYFRLLCCLRCFILLMFRRKNLTNISHKGDMIRFSSTLLN